MAKHYPRHTRAGKGKKAKDKARKELHRFPWAYIDEKLPCFPEGRPSGPGNSGARAFVK
jgi:hypothetical protein